MAILNESMAIVMEDGFIFLDVTEKASQVFESGLFDLYIIHYDDSESLVEKYADINDAQECGLRIGIEVGRI